MHRSNLMIASRARARAVAAVVAVAIAAVLGACVRPSDKPALQTEKADTLRRHASQEPPTSGGPDLDYFPRRFPAPQGDIAPLPAQF